MMGVPSTAVKLRPQVSAVLSAVNDAVTINADECGLVTAVVDAVAAAAGAVLTFEGQFSDAGPWVVLSARPSNGTNHATLLEATATITTLPTMCWGIPALGAKRVRARLSALTSGTLTVRLIPSFQPL